ncbi:unnamed protein product [Adineta ricciae]|uniref:Uncharacterized protein n=1 Tax=Adineta ricciae TaxID=249248 RepID=A0A816F006_ADIRI|nr:unnamed protein product [Adineta ricciae]CAF1652574.1 unnamed protein product [Adineta ricciae]
MIHSFHSEVLKLSKPTIQYEVRKKKPQSTNECLTFAKEAKELIQLSNITYNPDINPIDYSMRQTQMMPSSPFASSNTVPSYSMQQNTHPSTNFRNYNSRNRNSNNRNSFFQSRNFQQQTPRSFQTKSQANNTFPQQNQPHPQNNFSNSSSNSNGNSNNYHINSRKNSSSNTNTSTKPPIQKYTANVIDLSDPSVDTDNISESLSSFPCSQWTSSDGVVSDGIAPFRVLDTVQLTLQFANSLTIVIAQIADNLCTNMMILGMDYINSYNLSFNMKYQTISIEYDNQAVTMSMDQAQPLKKSDSLGYITSTPSSYFLPAILPQISSSIDDTTITGDSSIPVIHSGDISLTLPVQDTLLSCITDQNSFHYSINVFCCNTIHTPSDSILTSLDDLIQSIEDSSQADALYQLLVRYFSSFNIDKHNIAKTCIHHVINTTAHSPPACKPYPQPDIDPILYEINAETSDFIRKLYVL